MYWRGLTCDRCWRRCRYRSFRTPGASLCFGETRSALHVDDEDPQRWRYKTKGVVLGQMHQVKREAWSAWLEICPHAGELVGPRQPIRRGAVRRWLAMLAGTSRGCQRPSRVTRVAPEVMVDEATGTCLALLARFGRSDQPGLGQHLLRWRTGVDPAAWLPLGTGTALASGELHGTRLRVLADQLWCELRSFWARARAFDPTALRDAAPF